MISAIIFALSFTSSLSYAHDKCKERKCPHSEKCECKKEEHKHGEKGAETSGVPKDMIGKKNNMPCYEKRIHN